MATLQVCSIDNQLYSVLKSRAEADNRSISQEVISILKEYLSRPNRQYKSATEAFLEIAGSWNDDRNAEDIKKSRSTKRFSPESMNVFD